MENSEKIYFVCYMDILGFKDFVQKSKFTEEDINQMKNIYNDLNNFMSSSPKYEGEKSTKILLSKINSTIFSDSIIISMPLEIKELDEIDMKSPKIYQTLFFRAYCGLMYTQAFTKYGRLLKGAITIGKHEEDYSNGKRFIFSKALVDAVLLEKNDTCHYPRIFVSDEAYKYIVKDLEKKTAAPLGIYIDSKGIRCLDIYLIFRFLSIDPPSDTLGPIFSLIKDIIKKQVSENRTNPNVMEKYLYFINYHNTQIDKNFKNLLEYKVDIEKIEDFKSELQEKIIKSENQETE